MKINNLEKDPLPLSHQHPRKASKQPFLLIISLYLPILIGLAFIAFQKQVPIPLFMKDPLSIGGHPFYYGIMSNLGIVFWCAAAAICFFTAFILRQSQANSRISRFIFFSGLLTTILMVDDLWMVHEDVFPNFLGLPEKLCMVLYAIFAIGYFLTFRRTILQTNWLLLALSFGWIALSLGFDLTSNIHQSVAGNLRFFLEDGTKLLGIATWMIYYAHTCWQVLKQHIILKSAIAPEKIPVLLD